MKKGAGSVDRLLRIVTRSAGGFGCNKAQRGWHVPHPGRRPFQPWDAFGLALGLLAGWGYLSDKLWLRRISRMGWYDRERAIDWQSGCCVLFRGTVLRGFSSGFG